MEKEFVFKCSKQKKSIKPYKIKNFRCFKAHELAMEPFWYSIIPNHHAICKMQFLPTCLLTQSVQKIRPQCLQWCFLLVTENPCLQVLQSSTSSSCCHLTSFSCCLIFSSSTWRLWLNLTKSFWTATLLSRSIWRLTTFFLRVATSTASSSLSQSWQQDFI